MMNNMGMPGLPMIIVYGAIVVIPFWQLWKRTGHNPWMSLLMFVPLVNLIMLYVLAFKAWPSESSKG